MKVRVMYEGTEISVSENVKECLDDLKRLEENRARRNRRNELLWDSSMIEGLEDILLRDDDIEEKMMNKLMLEKVDELINRLDDIDRRLIEDRFVREMKLRELEEKYDIPTSTIARRIEKALRNLREELK